MATVMSCVRIDTNTGEEEDLGSFDMLDTDEANSFFDDVSRKLMGMSGKQVLEKWDAGEWADMDYDDVPGLAEIAVLIPFGR